MLNYYADKAWETAAKSEQAVAAAEERERRVAQDEAASDADVIRRYNIGGPVS